MGPHSVKTFFTKIILLYIRIIHQIQSRSDKVIYSLENISMNTIF